MKWANSEGKTREGFKMPYHRRVKCPAYEAHEECEYYGFGSMEGGWEGSLCFHPKAEGNKGGWLIICPIQRPDK